MRLALRYAIDRGARYKTLSFNTASLDTRSFHFEHVRRDHDLLCSAGFYPARSCTRSGSASTLSHERQFCLGLAIGQGRRSSWVGERRWVEFVFSTGNQKKKIAGCVAIDTGYLWHVGSLEATHDWKILA
jgi:hypothetical protein